MVSYKGTNYAFNVPEPQAGSRLVIPVPTLSGVRLDWAYENAVNGVDLGGPPAFMTQIQATLDYQVSPILPPTATSWTFAAGDGIREKWIRMAYKDSLGNTYVVLFTLLPP